MFTINLEDGREAPSKASLYIKVPGVACAHKTLICLAVTLSQFETKMLRMLLDNFFINLSML